MKRDVTAALSKAAMNQAKMRRLMRRHELSAHDVARLCGVKANTVWKWLAGTYPTPHMAVEVVRLTYLNAAA